MHPLIKTVVQRLALGLLTFLVSILIFSALAFLPSNFAKQILGQAATPETVAAFEREIGLDRPPVERYFNWLGKVATGDFGESFASRVGYRRIGRRDHRAAALEHAVPRLADGRLSPCRWRSPSASWRRSIATACSTAAINAVTLTTISFPGILHRLHADADLRGETALVALARQCHAGDGARRAHLPRRSCRR